MSRSRERLGEPSRPAIMGSSSFTGRRWAATGRCLKKDPTAQAEAAAAGPLACRGPADPRQRPQSDPQGLLCPDLCRRPADQESDDETGQERVIWELGPRKISRKPPLEMLSTSCVSCASGCQTLYVHALCDERAIRLMKDHFVDDRPFTAKFDEEALQFRDAEPSAFLRRKAIGRLIVGLQHKLAFRIHRHTMCRRATLETADAPFAESCKGAVAGRKTYEHNIFDHGLKRRRETDNATITIGQEGDGQLVWRQTIWHLGQFEQRTSTSGTAHP